jgi:hypothetical protein
MVNLSAIAKQLKKERDRVERQLHGLNAALVAFANMYSGAKPRRKMSASARKRIAVAQKARWAKARGQQKAIPITGKRTVSASSRRRMAAAQRARWAKVKAGKKAA